jgi:peptidyl-prolyl cis-trans isomerase D
MAIIGKIREKSVLVLVLVGISLVLFILGDFLTGAGGGQRENYVGEIFGEPIDAMEYEKRVSEAIERETQNRQMQGMPVDPTMNDQVREQVWEQYITELVSQREVDYFNFSISSEELNDMVTGENIHPWLLQEKAFQDMFGRFSADSVKRYLNLIQSRDDDQFKEMRRQWRQFEISMKKSKTGMKYNNLLSKGVYATRSEAQKSYLDESRIYRVRFVVKKYFDIPDSMVTVTDEDLKAYYEKNKFRKIYEQPGSRMVEYVEFPIIASEADKKKTFDKLVSLKETFEKTKEDSVFVMQYSDNPFFMENRFHKKGDFTPEIDSLIQLADSGTVIGPFEQMGYYKMVKIRDSEMEKEATVRHILLGKDKGTSEQLKKRADSLKNVIKRNKNFEAMVEKFSDDPGKVTNKGTYEWFSKGQMVPEFEDAGMNGKIGEFRIVETQFGVHLIEVLAQRPAKRQEIAVVESRIRPFDETKNEVKLVANEFLSVVGTDTSKFQSTAQELKVNVLTAEIYNNMRTLNQNEETREFVRWSLTAAEGDVSDLITIGEKVVVARLINVKQKGVPEFEDVKEQMRIKVLQEKKAEMLEKQMSNAKTLEEVAQITNTMVIPAELKFSSTTIKGGGGNEPEVIGTIFSFGPSQVGLMSVPIRGKVGVYVVILDKIDEPAPKEDVTAEQQNLNTTMRARAGTEALRALKENAKVIDERPVQ